MVRMSSEVETNIVSVERVKEYSEAPTEVNKTKISFTVMFYLHASSSDDTVGE